MAKNYTISFKSLRTGTDYTVSIGGGTGAAVPLTPGAQPFTTQEDDNEDNFTPVRTQSGYLRIVDNGLDADGNSFDWHDLIPDTDTSRPVTLSHVSGPSAVIDWEGFMQAQDFGSVLYGNPQERAFPIQCVLTVTQGTDINYQETAIHNFAYLLKQIIDSIPSAQRPSQIKIQGGSHAQSLLLKQIDWQNFVDEDADGNLSARFSMYECLEDMCAFWGWTARTKASTLYLTCADDRSLTTWLSLSYNNLTTMAGGTAAGSTTEYYDDSDFDNLGDIFASVDNDDYIQRGYNEAEVTVEINAAEQYIVDPFDNALEKEMKNSSYSEGYNVGDVHYTKDVLDFDRWHLEGECLENYASFNFAGNWNKTIGNVIHVKKSYNSGNVFVSLKTKYEHAFYDGFFMITGTVYRNGERYDTTEGKWLAGNADAWMRFGIGKTRATAQWWNGRSWGSTVTACRLTLGNKDNQMYTRYWNGSVLDPDMTESNIINVNGLSGLLFIEILGSNSTVVEDIEGEKTFDIEGFKVQFMKNDTVAKIGYPNSGYYDVQDLDRPSRYAYKSSNTNKVRNEMNVDTIYGSENMMPPAYGVLLNPNGTYLTTISYPGTATPMRPEQHLADRITEYWETSKRRMKVEVRTDEVPDITPQYIVTLDNTDCHPIGISREWCDDVTILTLLEMPT